MKKKHPIQPLIEDSHGTIRFKENKLIRRLLEQSGISLNEIGLWDVSKDDFSQFAQLIGYSHDGYCGLEYADRIVADAAEQMCNYGMSEQDARMAALESRVKELETSIRTILYECEEAIPGVLDE